MGIGSEIIHTLFRELRRTIRSAKGIVGTALFLLGGIGFALVVFNTLSRLQYYSANRAQQESVRENGLQAMYDGVEGKDEIVRYLLKMPEPLIAYYPMATFFVGMLIFVWGFDAIAGDVQYRTIRYVTLRARRPSLVIGRWLALWLSSVIANLLVSAVLWLGLVVKGGFEVGVVAEYGFRVLAASSVFSLWYAALTIFCSSLYRTPVLGLLTTLGISVGLYVVKGLSSISTMPEWVKALHKALPGSWDDLLLSPAFSQWGVGMGVCFAWTFVAVAAASVVLQKRDV
jgi:ABC-type transport system involved in multi-copper enzyme maturation permease subunit